MEQNGKRNTWCQCGAIIYNQTPSPPPRAHEEGQGTINSPSSLIRTHTHTQLTIAADNKMGIVQQQKAIDKDLQSNLVTFFLKEEGGGKGERKKGLKFPPLF